jgi:hypothetical protein
MSYLQLGSPPHPPIKIQNAEKKEVAGRAFCMLLIVEGMGSSKMLALRMGTRATDEQAAQAGVPVPLGAVKKQSGSLGSLGR